MSVLNNITEMYDLISQGQSMEALEKFYADNVVVEEATGERREGKDAQRQAIQGWFGMVKEFHGSGVDGITANEDQQHSMVETWMDVSFQDGNRVKMKQVAVQNWDNGQIVSERFYYNPGNMGQE